MGPCKNNDYLINLVYILGETFLMCLWYDQYNNFEHFSDFLMQGLQSTEGTCKVMIVLGGYISFLELPQNYYKFGGLKQYRFILSQL